jgi:cytochrome c oxidase subunit 2
VAAFLVGWTFHTENREDSLAAKPGLQVRVVGSRWHWSFDYIGTGKSVNGTDARAPTLVVPVGTVVRFSLTSPDVIHSFWIPERRFKRDAFPGSDTRFDLTWSKPAFDRGGACAEYCGGGHDTMVFNVRAVPRDRFTAWLAAR